MTNRPNSFGEFLEKILKEAAEQQQQPEAQQGIRLICRAIFDDIAGPGDYHLAVEVAKCPICGKQQFVFTKTPL